MNRVDIKIRIGESVFRKTFSSVPVYWWISEWYWGGRLRINKIIIFFCNLFK